jgi:hypothetical protein
MAAVASIADQLTAGYVVAARTRFCRDRWHHCASRLPLLIVLGA